MVKVPAKKPPAPKVSPDVLRANALRMLYKSYVDEWFVDNKEDVGDPPSQKDLADIVGDFVDQYSTALLATVEASVDSFLSVAVSHDDDGEEDDDEDDEDEDDEDEDEEEGDDE